MGQRALCRAVQDGILLSALPDFWLLLVKLLAKTQANTCLSCPISCSTTPSIMHKSSACARHLHIVHTYTSSAHIVCMCICHPHIICSTPHGQRGPKLSFYFDRNWLLNGICHNNVELFHFRIL